jgi:hypothetical protein
VELLNECGGGSYLILSDTVHVIELKGLRSSAQNDSRVFVINSLLPHLKAQVALSHRCVCGGLPQS